MTSKLGNQRAAVVTGAAGFLGRRLAMSAAAQGYRIIAIGHGVQECDGDPFVSEWHEGDVSLETLANCSVEPDVVFHCAGGASVAHSFEQPHRDFQRTVESTVSVLEFARTAKRRPAVVLPSSAAVYGCAAVQPIGVNSRLNPVSPYGLHKRIAEDLTNSYAKRFGLRASIVRLFSVYGPGLRKQLLWDACQRLTTGDGVFGGSGAETRDWLHVDDAASLMVQASTRASPECPIVNGGTGTAVPISSILDELCSELGAGTSIEFSGLSRPGDPTDYVADISEAIGWGWRPAHHWRTGIREYARWFKEFSPLLGLGLGRGDGRCFSGDPPPGLVVVHVAQDCGRGAM